VPELPEVEVLVRHLAPLLNRRVVRAVSVRRRRVIEPTTEREFESKLIGARFCGVVRRGKYLIFTLRRPRERSPLLLLGHLGMTGRMYLQSCAAPLPKHAAVVLDLCRQRFVFEDMRYFGRLTLDTSALDRLGPEPFGEEFSLSYFDGQLKRSAQAIKVKLLDQSLVAGIGNLYASEILFRAGISPRMPARRLSRERVRRLHDAIRSVLREAIKCGSTIPLDFAGTGPRDGLFYHGRSADAQAGAYSERLCVYDRVGKTCLQCGAAIRRIVQAARSTFFCPRCQRQ
jgi:formamidopyrimidine-DNA glycosylase